VTFTDSRGRRGSFATAFMHIPHFTGLANLGLAPNATREERNRAHATEKLMCSYDVVVLESGLHDLGLPITKYFSQANPLLWTACAADNAAAADSECEAILLPALTNQTWRLHPLSRYRANVLALMEMWTRCRKRQPSFRGIFKLSPSTRPRHAVPSAPMGVDPRVDPHVFNVCTHLQWGYNPQAHHMHAANTLARQLVEEAGFEVFDGFAPTLHAHPRWYDTLNYRIGGKVVALSDLVHIEVLSDTLTQLLVNQICDRAAESK
jgi:hypothetical protein